MTPLWEMQTSWFVRKETEHINSTFTYSSWKDFQECKPYKLWKPYILSSWSWKMFQKDDDNLRRILKRRDGSDKTVFECSKSLRPLPSAYDKPIPQIPDEKKTVEMLQIVFLSPDRFSGMHRAEIIVDRQNEDEIRDWLKRHLPTFWIL
jgi:hypothetical protein